MPITMQGPWTVSVFARNAAFPQRFVITGSSNGVDGAYNGVTATAPVDVQGDQWSISVQHDPPVGGFRPSDERITTPVRSGGLIRFRIESNDSGNDSDFNDLVLQCSIPESDSEFVVYGKVQTYSGRCLVNPCATDLVIDSRIALASLLQYSAVRTAVQAIRPDLVVQRKRRVPPKPDPDPEPFTPVVIPLAAGASAAAVAGSALTASTVLEAARLRDRFRLIPCQLESRPGLLLRFQEYDRTAAELAGGPRTGTGTRRLLGFAVTDMRGNYIFRFSWGFDDLGEELGDIAAGENPAVALRPDVLVQVVTGPFGGAVLAESPVRANVGNLTRINLCFPESQVGQPPAACRGLRVIQAIGNVITVPGAGNTLDAEGRITATHPSGPLITQGAWVGGLHLYGCFLDTDPAVVRYTVRHRRHPAGGAYAFVEEPYYYVHIPHLGSPPNDPGNKVGPFFDMALDVDGGGPQVVASYRNIEADLEWLPAHSLRKVILSSALYAPNSDPGTVEFLIEGYDASGVRVPGAHDTIRLYIDNRPVTGDIASISLGGSPAGECGLFDLPSPNAPLTVRFRVDHPGGFTERYSLGVLRGSGTPVPVNSELTVAADPGSAQPLLVAYSEVTFGPTFFGTFDGGFGAGADGYVDAKLTATSGAWLPEGHTFCAFAFEIYGDTRATDGYSLSGVGRLDVELVGITFGAP